jgi:glycosyltransferase involved in cell wall biosynthesis
MPSVTVVIPVFNARESIAQLCSEILAELHGPEYELEIILVEDCSLDDSWSIVESLASNDERIRGISLGRNFGQHNALLCGIRSASHEIIVTMDDDLQHPVSQIQILMDELAKGFDVVYGVPRAERHGILRNLATRMTKLALQGTIGSRAARDVSAFRVFYTYLRDGFSQFESPSVSIDVLLTWSTSRFSSVKVEHQPRSAGRSNYTLRKLVSHAFNLVTGFSALPLKLASIVGFVITVFGVAILTYVLAQYFVSGRSVPGFAFLASIITIFSGTQMFVMGIFGEYLARIHFRTLNRPPYVIRTDTDSQSTCDPTNSGISGDQ